MQATLTFLACLLRRYLLTSLDNWFILILGLHSLQMFGPICEWSQGEKLQVIGGTQFTPSFFCKFFCMILIDIVPILIKCSAKKEDIERHDQIPGKCGEPNATTVKPTKWWTGETPAASGAVLLAAWNCARSKRSSKCKTTWIWCNCSSLSSVMYYSAAEITSAWDCFNNVL